jgi:lipoate-protein ligase A
VNAWAHVVEPQGRSGPINMGVDAALLALARKGGAFLRLYRWDPPCLSFGRNEPATRRYDRAAITTRALDTVRRPTGGRAVWHDTEVTYAVAAPIARFGSLPETYRAIHEVLAQAVTSLGAHATLAPRVRAPRPDAGACFASPVGGEVLAQERKVIGSAQVRDGTAFLQHGSILIENRQQRVAELTVGGADAPPAAGLDEIMGRVPTFSEVVEAIAGAAQSAWGGPWTRETPPEPRTPNPFADPSWTWRR